MTDAARLQYRASRADRDATALSVAAQTAQAYVGLLALDAQLTVSRETVKSRREALRLACDQARVGYISQFELTQAQSEYEAVEQAIPQIELALRDQAAFAYRGATLAAFREVETALTGVRRYQQQIARVTARRNILLRSVALSTDRYQSGFAAYIEQLDAQRNLYSTEMEAITLRQDQLDNLITLYRALGGGWSADAEAGRAPPRTTTPD